MVVVVMIVCGLLDYVVYFLKYVIEFEFGIFVVFVGLLLSLIFDVLLNL